MVASGQMMGHSNSHVRRASSSTGLYDLVDLILEKGLVIDAYVRVCLVGLEVLTVEARVVIASVDTYLRFAAGAERLHVYRRSESPRLPETVGASSKSSLARGTTSIARRLMSGDEDAEEDYLERGQEIQDDSGEKSVAEDQPRQERQQRRNGSGKPARSGARR